MRKVTFGLVCLIVLMSCDLAIPKSVTIKANPGLYVPLGSPFKSFEDNERLRLEDLISPENIQKMMGDANNGTGVASSVAVYEYRLTKEVAEEMDVDPSVQTYLVHYPIAEMQLDLKKYVKGVIDEIDTESKEYLIPDAVNGSPLETLFENYPAVYLTNEGPELVDKELPLFIVPLTEMSRLVASVTGTFGLEITNVPDHEDGIEVCIPALGITTYKKGTLNGDLLRFTNETTLDPQEALENGELLIYVRLTGPYPAKSIKLDLVFDWEEATIDTAEWGGRNNILTASYPIDNNLGEFLGSGIDIKSIKGYIYVGGENADFDATMSLKFNDNELIPANRNKLELVEARPQFAGTFTERLPSHSLEDPIDLEDIINVRSSNSPKLHYEVKIKEWKLHAVNFADDDTDDEKITVDLVILLPLEFKVTGESPLEHPEYVTLNLDKVFNFPDGGDNDFLLRGDTETENGLFKYVENVTISLNSIRMTLLESEKLAILAYQETSQVKTGYNKLIPLNNGVSVTFSPEDIGYPFAPQFKFLIKKDDGEDFATFRILQTEKPEFDFFLAIMADVLINETKKF